jgi:hypothetical protein
VIIRIDSRDIKIKSRVFNNFRLIHLIRKMKLTNSLKERAKQIWPEGEKVFENLFSI